MIRIPKCFLCDRALLPIPGLDFQIHLPEPDCEVRYTDAWGVSVPDEAVPSVAPAREPTSFDVDGNPRDPDLLVQRFTPVDTALDRIYATHGLPRLGGQSSGRGWSSVGLFQKCRYAWNRRYRTAPTVLDTFLAGENPHLALGSIVHGLLAAYYVGMMPGEPYAVVTPAMVIDGLRTHGANPELINEGERLFGNYELFYRGEAIEPLAVEHDLRDPRTGSSTRYDLLAYFPDEAPGRLPGTYIVEHKTASRFDRATLVGWFNDGEILGEVGHYKRLGLEKRFGPLQGVIVNILGKQKDPQLHRTIVAPSLFQLDGHFQDLREFEAEIAMAIATNRFPRSRRSCVDRYGLCEYFDHCQTGAP